MDTACLESGDGRSDNGKRAPDELLFVAWLGAMEVAASHQKGNLVCSPFPAGLGRRSYVCKQRMGCVQVEITQPRLSLGGNRPRSARSGHLDSAVLL